MISELMKKLLPHNTRSVVIPPGEVQGMGEGKVLLVPSLMRSGTHLLIDAILNNFPAYRRCPLYIDLDQFVASGREPQQLLSMGNYVVKTHFPQVMTPGLSEAVTLLVTRAAIVSPVRDLESILRSMAAFDPDVSEATLLDSVHRFDLYWQGHSRLEIPFKKMVSPSDFDPVIESISQISGAVPQMRRVRPPTPDQRRRVIFHKAMTRIFGCRAPVINTTISFAQKKRIASR